MRPPRLARLWLTICLSAISLLLPSERLQAQPQQFEFATMPVGTWNLAQDVPALGVSHTSVSLQVEETAVGPAGSPARILELKGDRRGFRNVKDFAPPIREGVIRYDVRVQSGGLLVTGFESTQSKETIGRGILLLFQANGSVESYFGDIGERHSKRHGHYKRGVWYRAEITIRLSEKGGGTYDVQITDLSTGEPLALNDATQLPIDAQIFSIGGWDFNLTRSASHVDLDNLVFSPTLSKEAQ